MALHRREFTQVRRECASCSVLIFHTFLPIGCCCSWLPLSTKIFPAASQSAPNVFSVWVHWMVGRSVGCTSRSQDMIIRFICMQVVGKLLTARQREREDQLAMSRQTMGRKLIPSDLDGARGRSLLYQIGMPKPINYR